MDANVTVGRRGFRNPCPKKVLIEEGKSLKTTSRNKDQDQSQGLSGSENVPKGTYYVKIKVMCFKQEEGNRVKRASQQMRP